VAAYHRLLECDDAAVRERAARDWCVWEEAVVSATPGYRANPRYESAEFRMAFARIVTHYFTHGAWLEDDQLLRNADRLAGIPGVLIHGRLDLGGPLAAAWDLHRAWPDSELVVVGTAGHDTRDPGMSDSIVTALNRFARAGSSMH
jgi:proline iminopeptidase